jgi:hypothetical protein
MRCFKFRNKGFMPMNIVVWLIGALVAVSLLLVWQKDTAEAAVDEKATVEACRTTNEARVFVEHKTSEYVATPRFCKTIDKTKGSLSVPTKRFGQNEEGAKQEIRDMVAKCWYMWLEGSEPNIFRDFPGEKSCHICYRFRIKDTGIDGDNPITLTEIADSMESPYIAYPSINNTCDPTYGGILQDPVGQDRSCSGDFNIKVREDDTGKICCRKSTLHECENKGGRCYTKDDTKESGYELLYDDWACPQSNQKCYLKDEGDNIYSYVRYITGWGDRGGHLYFHDPNDGGANNGYYSKNEIYAISFVSPAKQNKCSGFFCPLNILKNFVTTTLVPSIPIKVIELTGKHAGGPVGITSKKMYEGIFGFGLENVPNSIIVSSYDTAANEFGCDFQE